MEKINVVLPEKFDLVVGDTFQLFYTGVVQAPNPYVYNIVSICEEGRNCPRYFEITPKKEGQLRLKILVYGANREVLGSGETILNIALPVQPKKPVNVLCVGDSLTAGGQWPAEAMRRLVAEDGEPKGDGLKNINFIGTCKKGDVGYEGYGGWRWETYFTTAVGAMWIVCHTHDKTIEDQHSLWKDENGNIWQLETLAAEWLKFNRYMQHTGEMPGPGKLTAYKNVTHTSPIVMESTGPEGRSPFYDETSGKVDFKSYCERNGFDGIDIVYVLLGGNGHIEAFVEGLTIEEHCLANAEKARIFTNLVHESYPDAKVKILGMIPPSFNGGMGKSYGATLPLCDQYGYMCHVLKMNEIHEQWATSPEYKDFVEFVNVSAQFDGENNFPTEEKPVNTRNKKTEIVGINGAHPMEEGYMQVADAVYRNLVHEIKKY